MEVRLSRRAERAQGDIEVYLHQENPAAAERTTERLLVAVFRLAENPKRGPRWDAPTRVLHLPPLPYRIHDRIAGGTISVITFAHTAQRPPRL